MNALALILALTLGSIDATPEPVTQSDKCQSCEQDRRERERDHKEREKDRRERERDRKEREKDRKERERDRRDRKAASS